MADEPTTLNSSLLKPLPDEGPIEVVQHKEFPVEW